MSNLKLVKSYPPIKTWRNNKFNQVDLRRALKKAKCQGVYTHLWEDGHITFDTEHGYTKKQIKKLKKIFKPLDFFITLAFDNDTGASFCRIDMSWDREL